jgi:dipeptidyl aminopeptidase/acylaminoacyl peptidase
MNTTSFLSIVLSLVLCSCSIAPIHPSLKEAVLPELIPVRDFVADRKANGGYQVSPDGKKLVWMAVKGMQPAVFVSTLGSKDVKTYAIHPRYFRWAADSRHLLFVSDKGGDENTHIYACDTEQEGAELTDLTPYEKTVAHILRVVKGGSEIVMVDNHRDKKVFDIYKIDIPTARQTVLATNPGDVADWITDRYGNLIGRVRQSGGRHILQVKQDAAGEGWKSTADWSIFDSCSILEVGDDGKRAWALSNRGRDKVALVQVNLTTGAETVIHAEPDADLEGAIISNKTHAPLAVYSNPDWPKVIIFDARLRDAWSRVTDNKPAALSLVSADDEERIITASIATDHGIKHYLYNTDSGERTLLGQDSMSRHESSLATIEPISLKSRDGLDLHGYLTLPVGVKPEKLPMVLMVHGGPWHRDIWALQGAPFPQFFANRGYAVLTINYRGSTGYGRAFKEMAIGEFAGKMHDDLLDGVDWAVRSGIADARKIAIFGGSYGGYASLVGLTFTPDVFACGIALVGPSDLARLIESAPEYWELAKPWWYRYVGNPADPGDRKRMDAQSPLYKADAVTKPVLIMHGANDPRVKLSQSDEMVSALRKAGKQVDYVVFTGDGHGTRNWANNLKLYRKTEDFLAACLGGRSSGFDYYQFFSWAF